LQDRCSGHIQSIELHGTSLRVAKGKFYIRLMKALTNVNMPSDNIIKINDRYKNRPIVMNMC
jgi:hypothetical protein